jgi:hypothetical protein
VLGCSLRTKVYGGRWTLIIRLKRPLCRAVWP